MLAGKAGGGGRWGESLSSGPCLHYGALPHTRTNAADSAGSGAALTHGQLPTGHTEHPLPWLTAHLGAAKEAQN